MNEIPGRLKTAATRTIAKVDNEYFAADGVVILQNQLNEKRDGVAAHIYKLALSARKVAKNVDEALQLFRAACTYAEERYKAEHEITNITERIPAWSQFKSRIARAMRHGLDPSKHKSERALRDALHKKLAAEAEAPTRAPERQPAQPADIQDWLDTTGVHSALQMSLSRIVLSAEYVKPGKRKQAELILQDAAKALSQLVDQKKITADATRDALRMAA